MFGLLLYPERLYRESLFINSFNGEQTMRETKVHFNLRKHFQLFVLCLEYLLDIRLGWVILCC